VIKVDPVEIRTKLRLSIDSVMMCTYKLVKGWELLQKNEKEEQLIQRISLKTVDRIERAIYNPKKLYVWYEGKKRIDVEFKREAETAKVLSKIKFLLKKINIK
jgi:hypothetical protein